MTQTRVPDAGNSPLAAAPEGEWSFTRLWYGERATRGTGSGEWRVTHLIGDKLAPVMRKCAPKRG